MARVRTIMHTEASLGWGGQEMRILKEAKEMREHGYVIFFATHPDATLTERAREAGFTVFTLPLEKKYLLRCVKELRKILLHHQIDLVNTHSSADAWIGGIAARLARKAVVRTRHLSTPIRGGLNSWLLYNCLADYVVTTCQDVVDKLFVQARLPPSRCSSIPTGVNPLEIKVDQQEIEKFRTRYGILPSDCVVGMLCVLRSWKGILDFFQAAKLSEENRSLKWLLVGGGAQEERYRQEMRRLGVEDQVIMTGHLEPPYTALAVMDIFLLLSTANEGVSQASLQAAYLKKPLVTTSVGGLKEVCIPNKTGFLVNTQAPIEVADKVSILAQNRTLRENMGREARQLVLERFTVDKMVESMENVYRGVFPS